MDEGFVDPAGNEIIEKTLVKGEEMGLGRPFLNTLLKSIHQESINHQNVVMNRVDKEKVKNEKVSTGS